MLTSYYTILNYRTHIFDPSLRSLKKLMENLFLGCRVKKFEMIFLMSSDPSSKVYLQVMKHKMLCILLMCLRKKTTY